MYRLDAYEWLFQNRIEQLETFIEQTEKGAQSEFDEFSKWAKGATAGMSDADASEFIDHYYDDLAMVRDVVPLVIRYSQVLIVYGFYEHEAVALCRMLHADGVTTKKPKKNLYIQDVKQYLVDEANFAAKTFGSAWKFLDNARNLRNAIAHNSGRIRSGGAGDQVKAFIKKQSDLDLDGLDNVKIEKGFVTTLLEKSGESLNALAEEARKKYEKIHGKA